MSDWKIAFKIVRSEWKVTWKALFSLLLIYSIYMYSMAVTNSISSELTGISDLLFILLFSFAPGWARPQSILYKRINEDLWASPMVIMLSHLAVSKGAIIKSRMISYFFFSFPIQLITLIILYFASDVIQGQFTLFTYSSFIIFWLCFSVYVGYGVVASDAGMNRGSINKIHSFLGIALLFLVAILIVSSPMIFTHSIVEWSIILVQAFPILTIIISILLAIFGIFYWQASMKKTMQKVDYL